MQPLQHDSRCAAAEDTSIAHAAAPSNLSAKKRRVSCDFQRPNISLTQQFHCHLQALPCKSHYNRVDHRGNQQDAAIICCKLQPKITKPIGTARPIISLTDLKAHFTTAGAKRTQNRHSRTRRTDAVPPVDAGSHFARENTWFRAISNVQTSA